MAAYDVGVVLNGNNADELNHLIEVEVFGRPAQ